MCQSAVDALVEIPGLRITLEHDEYNYLIPHAVINFTRQWHGRDRDQIYEAMIAGDPPIYLHNLGNPDDLAVDPLNLDDQELEVVIRRLREEVLPSSPYRSPGS